MLFLITCGFICGILTTLTVLHFLLRRWFQSLPLVTPAWKAQTESYVLPKELNEALKDEGLKKQKESCLCLNVVLQFLFQELKDTKRIRRWAMKRMKLEFDEMLRSTTGKLLEHITVRDFNLGKSFPILQNAVIDSVRVNDDNALEEVTVLLDLTYSGRFQLAVDVDMVFGKSGYLSVVLSRLQGPARLQFTRHPYTHWSFAFTEDPVLQFEVESHFEGRPIAQLTSIIINQIRKTVRKKHTLPSYKIRYRPFFVMPVSEAAPQNVYYQGNKISIGQLQVVVLGCSRLPNASPDSHIYCSLALDSIQWMELMSFRRKLWIAHDVEVTKAAGQNIGLSFGEVFLVDKYEEMVVVTSVLPGSPAAMADIQKNDLLVAINRINITSSRQAARLMKNAAEKITLRMERAIKGFSGSNQKAASAVRNDDDANSTKSFQGAALNADAASESSLSANQNGEVEGVEYVPVIPLPAELEKPLVDETSSLKNFDTKAETQFYQSSSLAALSSTSSASSSPPLAKKGLTQILSSGSGLFQRKKAKSEAVPSSVDFAKGQKDLTEKCPDVRSLAKPDTQTYDGQALKKERKSLTDEGKVGNSSDVAVQPAVLKENQLNKKPATQTAAADPVESKSREQILLKRTACISNSSINKNGDRAKMRTTQFAKASSNPAFNEIFEFDVEEKHNYLNICIWNKQPEKLDKQSRVIKPEKDVLLGHVSIPLMDIALECLSTLQGDVTNLYNLTPSESKVETGRSQHTSLASHSGFEERLCQGDLSLRFLYTMESLSKKERNNIWKMQEDSEQAASNEKLTDASKDAEDFSTLAGNVYKSSATSVLNGRHSFSIAHFQVATYCNFCSKKIWLKTAFQCQLCQMVCHKKCMEKCQAQMQCGKPKDKIPKKENQKEKPDDHISAEDNERKPAAQLSEQNEESEELDGEVERKRHNSAPDESVPESDVKDQMEPLSSTSGMPRTRSTNSLGEMSIESLLMPTAKSLEDAENLTRMFHRVQNASNSDEIVVTQAKKMGKELYANLDPEARKEKLDSIILKLEVEISSESEHRADLVARERAATNKKVKKSWLEKIEKSDGKLQSLTVLMLHYCAGLQHCMDQEELERQRRLEQEQSHEQKQTREELETEFHEEQAGASKEARTEICDGESSGVSLESETTFPPRNVDEEKLSTGVDEVRFDEQLEDASAEAAGNFIAERKDDKQASSDATTEKDLDLLEVDEVNSIQTFAETVGMSLPVSVCQLLDAAKAEQVLEQSRLDSIVCQLVDDASAALISSIRETDTSESSERAAGRLSEEPLMMEEEEEETPVGEEVPADDGRCELLYVHHSSTETANDKTSVINEFTPSENVASNNVSQIERLPASEQNNDSLTLADQCQNRTG